jgi:Fe-S cluster biogenesis protein NfuA
MQNSAIRDEIQALEERLAHLEQLPPGESREAGLAAAEGLLRVYGEALRRVVSLIGHEAVQTLQEDELVSQLLLLHELHPASLEERVTSALAELSPYIGSHGGGIELVSIEGDVARVRLEGSCVGCSASTATLKLAVEEAVLRAAPELRAVEATEEYPITHDPPGPLLPMYEPGAAA